MDKNKNKKNQQVEDLVEKASNLLVALNAAGLAGYRTDEVEIEINAARESIAAALKCAANAQPEKGWGELHAAHEHLALAHAQIAERMAAEHRLDG